MVKKLLVIDLETGERNLLSSLWADQDYEVTNVLGQTVFTTTTPFTSTSKIDVFVNGILQRRDSEYTRNQGTSEITFSYTVPQNAWVMIRIYLAG